MMTDRKVKILKRAIFIRKFYRKKYSFHVLNLYSFKDIPLNEINIIIHIFLKVLKNEFFNEMKQN